MKPQLQLVAEDQRIADRFLETLEDALKGLEVLAQIQAFAGTAMMQHRAGKTENTLASLENYVNMLRAARGPNGK